MGCGASASASTVSQTNKPITVMPQPTSTATAEQIEKRGERTFIAVKPDGVQRNLVGEIIGRYERRGLKLVGLKMMQPSKEHAEEHYAEHKGKPFFEKITTAVSSGPMVAMAFEGLNAVAIGRMLLGATDPLKSTPGTIRGDFALEGGRNCCHGSDSVDSANRELALWFRPEELVSWTHCTDAWTYE